MKIYKSLGQNFVVLYKQDDENRIEGKVFATINWTKDDITGWDYTSKTEGGVMHDELNKDCRCLFEFSITWRGCWDDRIYFKDDEYFAEELEEMSNYWKEIQEVLREYIKNKSVYKEDME